MPHNLALAYLVVVKFGETPTHFDYDDVKVFCPNSSNQQNFELFVFLKNQNSFFR